MKEKSKQLAELYDLRRKVNGGYMKRVKNSVMDSMKSIAAFGAETEESK